MDEIELLQCKIEWLELNRQHYENQVVEFNESMKNIQQGSIMPSERDAIEFKIAYSEKIAKMLNQRILEVEAFILSRQYPEDEYHRAHADTIGSNSRLSDILNELHLLETSYKSKSNFIYKEVMSVKSEIADLVKNENYLFG